MCNFEKKITTMTFLKTILIILLVYYGLKIIFKFSKPFILRYIAKKATERFGQDFTSNSNQPQNEEGSITIDKSKANEKNSNKSVGDYVDFEELE